MLPSVGMPELIIILVIALIIFGPRKLPELGRSLGKSIGEFRKASNELKSTLEEEIRLEEQKEQRAKVEAEQASAVAAGAVTPTAPAAEPLVPPVDDHEPTVSRTNTGTPA
jgi:TatA/E family protein of Tat protein translocase